MHTSCEIYVLSKEKKFFPFLNTDSSYINKKIVFLVFELKLYLLTHVKNDIVSYPGTGCLEYFFAE